MSRETNAGTEKTWETVAEAMVSKVAKPDPVGIGKPWWELCYFIQSAVSVHRRILNREVQQLVNVFKRKSFKI